MPWTKEILREGEGDVPNAGTVVTVHCTGFGKNNDLKEKFWSTKDPGQQPFTFTVGKKEVIPAWDEGVLTMKLREKAMIKADADAAYGAGGFPAWGIMPNAELHFEIEVLSFKSPGGFNR
jgi:peptidylprolyl isomerase